MLKKFSILLTIFFTIFYFLVAGILVFPFEAFAKERGIQKASISHYKNVKEAHDTTKQQSGLLDYILTSNDLNKLKANDSISYQAQGSWPEIKNKGKPGYDDHLSFIFEDFFPHNVGVLENLKFYHYFSSSNSSNIHSWYYKIYVKEGSDWQYKGEITGSNQNEELNLLSFIDENKETDGLKIDFYLNRIDDTPQLYTSHDFVALYIEYKENNLPQIELLSPLNNKVFNLEDYPSYPVNIDLSFRVNDEDEEPLQGELDFGKGVAKEDGTCEFSDVLILEKEYNNLGNETKSETVSVNEDGVYCWQVKITDEEGSSNFVKKSAQFAIDLGAPLKLTSVNILPLSPSNKNVPQVKGSFNSSDNDSVKSLVLFYDEVKSSGYFYSIERTGNVFDSAKGYELYYLLSINPSSIKGSDFKGSSVNFIKDGNYKIYGFSQDEAGNISEPLILPLTYKIDTLAPQAPKVSSAYEGENIIISWDNVLEALYYEVYRDGNLIAITQNNKIVESNLEKGKTFTYWVVAVDEAGNRSLPSKKISIYILKPQVSSTSISLEAPTTYIPEALAKELPQEEGKKIETPSQASGEVQAQSTETQKPKTNWALIVAIILGALLVIGGGLYWWYSREEDEI